MSKNQRMCGVCFGQDLMIQDPLGEMVYCVTCSGFVPYITIDGEENKSAQPDVDADYLLALELSEGAAPASVQISHELCTHHCPHCGVCIFVEALNCRIFRCGVGINPHATEEEAAAIVAVRKVGCGKQFRIDEHNNVHKCTGL